MISIIVPVYNQADKLACCLESILEQSYRHFEIIVVNDGSTDNCLEIAERFKNKFKAIGADFKIIDQENKGAPNARNHGYQAAKGDYVLFCDADAILNHNYLFETINALKNNPEAAYAYCSFYWGDKLFKLQHFDRKKLRQMPYIHTISLIRTACFPNTGWDESLKRFQDWDLWLTMDSFGNKGVWIKDPLFRVCTGGTMSNWLPSIAYKILPFLPAVKRYHLAVRAIKEKHGILLPKKK